MRGYKANMIPGGVTPTINVSQYDNDYAVTVTLIEGAEIYTPPVGATVRVEGTKPDGHGFEYACTYQGNVVTMPIYTQMTVVAGRFPIELVVYQSGLRVGSCNIIFAVEKAPLGEDKDISETVIPDIIAGAQAQADAAAASATTASSAATNAVSARNAAIEAAQAAAQSAASLTVDTELSSTSTNPVQNKVIDATVTELKNELNGSTIYNYTDGKNIDNSGALVDATGVCVTDKIPYTWTGSTRYYYGEGSSDYAIAFYSSTDTLLQKYISSNNSVYRSINAESQVTGTVSYVRFSFKKNYSAKVTKNDSTELPVYWSVQATQGGGLIADVAEMQTDIEALQETAPAEGQIDAIETTLNGSTTYNYTEGKNLNSDGNLVDDPTSCVSDKIPYTWSGSTRYYYNELSTVYRIAFYGSDDSCLVSRQSQNNALYRSLNASELTESTVSYIRFSFKKSTTGRCVQNVNPEPADYWTAAVTHVEGVEEAISRLDDEKVTVYSLDYKATEDTIATGTTMSIATNVDSRKHDTIDFRADITSFTSVTVGHGYQVNHGMWVTVDGSNITTYDDEDGEQVAQQAHGLTISDFIHVLVIRGDNSRATIEVITGGGIYRWENVAWSGNRGSVFAFCTGTLTNAKLNAVFRDMNSLIFMFGDSYQSFGDQARYPYYLVQDGFTDFLAAGFPGANAAHGIAAFRAIIAKAKPKYVVWALGMNNSDTSSAVNAYWKTATDEVIATCDANNITIILATIPNVPDRIQTFKNDYVRNSGKRYIDFAKAVGAESQGSTWYTGMLSSDNMHPTDLGAKALYTQLLADFPEIMR